MHRKTISEGSVSKHQFPPNSVYPQDDDIAAKPLKLYICRVPGSTDVFLTPSKPPGSTVSAVDVLTSVYYVHVDSNPAFTGSDPVVLKLLRRNRGQESYELVADLCLPPRNRHSSPISRTEVFANVAMFSGLPTGPAQEISQFEIQRSSMDGEQQPMTEVINHDGLGRISQINQAEDSISWSEDYPEPVRRPLEKQRNQIWKKLRNRHEARAALCFITPFGTKCTMKSSTMGDSLKTYKEDVNVDDSNSRALAAELRFNLAPESAHKSSSMHKARTSIFALQKRKSMSFLNDIRAPGGLKLSDSNKSFDYHSHTPHGASVGNHPQSRINSFTEQIESPKHITNQVSYATSPRRHPRHSPLPPPPDTNILRDRTFEDRLIPKPSMSRKPVPPRRKAVKENVRPQSGQDSPIWEHVRKTEHVITSQDHSSNVETLNDSIVEDEAPPLTTRKDTLKSDPLALGRQQLGGGMDGQQAKLGKILIHNPGLRMTDTMVAANIAIWYQGFLQSSFSTTADL